VRRRATDYVRILRRRQLAVRTHGPWASVGSPTRRQGWKLHLSTVVLEAPQLLRAVLPVLEEAGADFKIVADSDWLIRLNEGTLGETQVGKFATVYPRSDAAAKSLARRLVECTRGFHGPAVATDLRLGDVVYARYGGFNPIVVRDRLGGHRAQIRGLTGGMRSDDYTVPFTMPRGARHPFAEILARSRLPARHRDPGAAMAAIGPGYLPLEVIRAHPKGSVYRALDLRNKRSMSVCVLKQGRPWCLADFEGRDIRTRLRHQVQVHADLESRAPVPHAGPYFEVEGHGFVAFEFVRGRTLAAEILDVLRGRPWWLVEKRRRRHLLARLIDVVDAVRSMHEAGYVHRDLNATNIIIGENGSVRLIDLEIAHRLDDPSTPFDAGTPGFVSPQQRARHVPAPADDVHAIGGLLIMALTGLDPQRAQFAAPEDRARQWSAFSGKIDAPLAELAARCLEASASQRPPLQEIRSVLQERRDAVATRALASPSDQFVPLVRAGCNPAVDAGLRGLLDQVPSVADGLWLSRAFDSDHGPHGATGGRFEMRRGTNRGVSGVLYVLGRLARFGHRTSTGSARARRAAAWLLSGAAAPDSGMPGLHFGDAGVSVALAEAVAGGIVDPSADALAFIARALRGRIDWPDVTHGAAGQGLAALLCADRLGDESLAPLATRCADFLLDAQRPSGAWLWPSSTGAPTRGTWTGFAHGVAGITYFLAEYARRTNDRAADRAWRSAVHWLLRQATRTQRTMSWPNRTGAPDRWSWWCHGSTGISLLFLRLFEWTREARFADAARRALNVHPRAVMAENLSQCHGLAGLGEAYLEAARVLDDRRWVERAQHVCTVLWNLRRAKRGSATWLVEGVEAPTADLMVGAGGVVHFLLRCSQFTGAMGAPLLLDPIA
jgi:class IV lanthipeptide synthase